MADPPGVDAALPGGSPRSPWIGEVRHARCFTVPPRSPVLSALALALRLTLTLTLTLALAGCTGQATDNREEGDPAATAALLPVFDPTTFDSIAWRTPREALDRGGTVYAYSCAKCHGVRGAGNGGYRLQGRLLRPPSFLAADWRFAADPVALREAIYRGNDRGMPHWGRAGLAVRDMDAVARYVTRLWVEAG